MKANLCGLVLVLSACSSAPTLVDGSQALPLIKMPDVCAAFNHNKSKLEAKYAKWNLVELKALLASPNAPTTISDLFARMNEEGLLGAARLSTGLVASSKENPRVSVDTTAVTNAGVALVYGSESPQHASIDFPRIIGVNAGRDFFFGIEGKQRDGEQLEWIQFHCTSGQADFEFGVVTVDPESSKLKLSTSALPESDHIDTDLGKKPIKFVCGTSGCHGKNMLRPNLQTYSLWKKMIGSNDTRVGNGQEYDSSQHASKPLETQALNALIDRTRNNADQYKRYIPVLSHLLIRHQERSGKIENLSLYQSARTLLSIVSTAIDRATYLASLNRLGKLSTDPRLFRQIQSTWSSLLTTDPESSKGLTDEARNFILGSEVRDIENADADSFCGRVAQSWEEKISSHRDGLQALRAAFPAVNGIDIEREIQLTRAAGNSTTQFCIKAGRLYYLGKYAQDLARSHDPSEPNPFDHLALDDWFAVKRPLKMNEDLGPLVFEPPLFEDSAFAGKDSPYFDRQNLLEQLFQDDTSCL